jgi:serine/threonine protein kinase
MEYLPLGDLHNYLGSPLPEHEGQQIATQILEGLDFMHDNDFAHRDLKPAVRLTMSSDTYMEANHPCVQNILVKTKGPRWWVKIADFGISKRAVEGITALRTLAGTPAFTAPEVLGFEYRSGSGSINDALGDSYTNAVDIWSTGVITFLILTGETYFKDPRRLGQYAARTIGFPLDALHARSTSDLGCDFTKTLMAATPQHRPTVKQALQHPWLIDLNRTATYAPPRYCFRIWCTYLRLLTVL